MHIYIQNAFGQNFFEPYIYSRVSKESYDIIRVMFIFIYLYMYIYQVTLKVMQIYNDFVNLILLLFMMFKHCFSQTMISLSVFVFFHSFFSSELVSSVVIMFYHTIIMTFIPKQSVNFFFLTHPSLNFFFFIKFNLPFFSLLFFIFFYLK